MRLKDKVVIVTGGSRGIGEAIATLFIEEGARVTIADILVTEGEALVATLNQNGKKAIFCRVDVTKEEDISAMFAATIAAFGKIDICVNNAGIRGGKALTTELPVDDWYSVIAVNLTGVYLVCRHALPIMMRQGGGTIVNIASISGVVATALAVPYCASKGGVTALTRSLAIDYAKFNIRVNAICPGLCETDLIKQIIKKSDDPEALVASYISMHPLGRMARPDDIAQAALYLASDESGFTTGSALMADGGYTAR